MMIKEQNFCCLFGSVRLYTKAKVTLNMPLQAQRGGRSIDLPIFNLCTIRGWAISATPQPPITWERAPVPIVEEAGWVARLVLIGKE
jgi:hypothetical protein